jgi:hypothetical protein
MALHQQGGSAMSGRVQAFAIGATLAFGLMTLAVISQSGGSITISTTGLTATVNSPD